MAVMDTRRMHEVCLALLKALGVNDLDNVVGFTLVCRHDDVPRLTVERYADQQMGDKPALVAAAELAPQIVGQGVI